MNFAPVPQPPGLFWLFFSPRGRLSRSLFFRGWLFWTLIFAACISAILSADTSPAIAGLGVLGLFVGIPLWLVCTVMMGFKRAHDIGVPGPVAFLLIIPGLSLISVLVFCLWSPRMEDNPYGDVMDGPPD